VYIEGLYKGKGYKAVPRGGRKGKGSGTVGKKDTSNSPRKGEGNENSGLEKELTQTKKKKKEEGRKKRKKEKELVSFSLVRAEQGS